MQRSATTATALDSMASFEALYHAHAAYVWAVLARLGVQAVADAHQEVFITAYRRRDSFQPGRPVRPWLVGIARRIAFRHRRSRARRSRKHDAIAVSSGQHRHESAGRIEARDFLARFVERLPEPRRTIFVAGEIEGRTGREISEAMDLGIDTVYGHLRAARARLKAALLEVEAPPMSRTRLDRRFALLAVQLRPSSASPWLLGLSKVKLAIAGTTAVAGVVLTTAMVVSGPAPEARPRDTARPATATAATKSDARPEPRPSARPIAEPPASEPSEAEPVAPEPVTASTIAPTASPPPRAEPRATTDAPSPAPGAASLRLMEARRALVDGDPQRALDLLHAHGRDFPGDLHDEVRGALRVEALCALGKTPQARGEASMLRRRFPKSSVAEHALARCPRAG